jgi:OmpA-OmpF porin, OOP family
MNKSTAIKSIALLSLMMTSAGSFAADGSGGYIGAALGKSTLDVDAVGSSDATAFKLFGGYAFNPYFAIEGAYYDGGDASVDILVGSVDTSNTGFNLSAVGRIPAGESFAVFGKIGYAFYKQESSSFRFLNITVPGQSESDQALSFGVGASYTFNQKFELRLEYETLSVSDGGYDAIMLGGAFKF